MKTYPMEVELFIHHVQHSYDLEPSIKVYEFEFKGDDERICIGSEKVTINVPIVDVTAKIIEALREKKRQGLVNAEIEAQQIEEKIQSLLAIEHKPGEVK